MYACVAFCNCFEINLETFLKEYWNNYLKEILIFLKSHVPYCRYCLLKVFICKHAFGQTSMVLCIKCVFFFLEAL